jgi:2'-5' RNA ligase
MRLFVALEIDVEIRERIVAFVESVCGFAPDARWMRPESLHVTLKFIGEKPEDEADKIKQALSLITSGAIALNFRGYGFFPSSRAPRVFWAGIDGGPALTTLAATVDTTLAQLGISKEEHAFNPHLTLARGGKGSGSPRWKKGDRPNRCFQYLQEKLAALPAPEFGSMSACEFFLYQSVLSPRGSKYTKLARFPLQ